MNQSHTISFWDWNRTHNATVAETTHFSRPELTLFHKELFALCDRSYHAANGDTFGIDSVERTLKCTTKDSVDDNPRSGFKAHYFVCVPMERMLPCYVGCSAAGSNVETTTTDTASHEQLHIMGISGTEDLKDILSDVKIAFGLKTRQHDAADAAFRSWNAISPRGLDFVVGHSLGASFATYLAYKSRDVNAVTVNPAPMPSNTWFLSAYPASPNFCRRVKNFICLGEILMKCSLTMPNVSTPGHSVIMTNCTTPVPWWKFWVSVPIHRHSLTNFIGYPYWRTWLSFEKS